MVPSLFHVVRKSLGEAQSLITHLSLAWPGLDPRSSLSKRGRNNTSSFAWSDPRGVAGYTEARAYEWPYANLSPADLLQHTN
jgi:hypothetical protein